MGAAEQPLPHLGFDLLDLERNRRWREVQNSRGMQHAGLVRNPDENAQLPESDIQRLNFTEGVNDLDKTKSFP